MSKRLQGVLLGGSVGGYPIDRTRLPSLFLKRISHRLLRSKNLPCPPTRSFASLSLAFCHQYCPRPHLPSHSFRSYYFLACPVSPHFAACSLLQNAPFLAGPPLGGRRGLHFGTVASHVVKTPNSTRTYSRDTSPKGSESSPRTPPSFRSFRLESITHRPAIANFRLLLSISGIESRPYSSWISSCAVALMIAKKERLRPHAF